jgi:glucose dehydrogenase
MPTQKQLSCLSGRKPRPIQNSAQPYQGQLEADDGQWVRSAKDYASTRYSSLREINVKQLQLAWTFSTGTTRGLEAAPLVVNNTLYLVTPWPNKSARIYFRSPLDCASNR